MINDITYVRVICYFHFQSTYWFYVKIPKLKRNIAMANVKRNMLIGRIKCKID